MTTRLFPLLGLAALAKAATVTYDFSIDWVTANPDGMFERPTIGINGKWPLPIMEANVGDQVIVNAFNNLGDQATSLHFHGLYMNGSTHMDGPSQVTQCAIYPGSSFTYNFTVKQPGTYWYHSHTKGQYPDGLRAPFIIHDPNNPFKDMYDEELVLTVSDWYHDQMPGLLNFFISKANPTGAEPVPNSALLNETQNLTIPVEPERTYLFRMINMGAFAGQYVWFEGHNITILEVDGIYTQPAEADMIYLSAAQRCSFLLTTRNSTTENFPIVASMDTTLFDQLPEDLNYNVTGWLVYDSKEPLPEPAILYEDFDPFDDMTLIPWDNEPLLGEPDRIITLDVIMDNLGDGANYAFFNNITYVSPRVPSLYTALNAGELATDPRIYGEYTHPFVFEKDEIIELVINNIDSGRHPFHLHGRSFQAVWRSEEEAGTFEDSNVTSESFTPIPMKRDTIVLFPEGNLVLRFRADNPGVWLFHCHLEWHVQSGLIATFVEAPLELQKELVIPKNHIDACEAAGVPTVGNAAANLDYLDLTGQNMPPPPLPAGFTTKGIVAMVFSCISGILGVAVIAWYGFADVPKEEPSTIVAPGKAAGAEGGVVEGDGNGSGSGDDASSPTAQKETVVGTISNNGDDEITASGGGRDRVP
ncbi:Cupredoxin [Rhypophila decipiens]|uniref:Cupredoxin n=1 Tax=Rhypophila decipiens TaxID=261697 RepID=A0AAN6Y1Z3_9PEZI|nr:Cupredoxin [Rhypophila decipiens]